MTQQVRGYRSSARYWLITPATSGLLNATDDWVIDVAERSHAFICTTGCCSSRRAALAACRPLHGLQLGRSAIVYRYGVTGAGLRHACASGVVPAM